MKTNIVAVVSAFILACFTSVSFGFVTDVVYLDFQGWDNAAVMSPAGQTFTDIYEDVDVTVTAVGDFDLATGYGGGWINTGGHLVPGSHSLRFSFSEEIPTIVEFETIDSEESLGVYNSGSEVLCNISGAAPTGVRSGGGLIVTGNGTGIDAFSGASHGQIMTFGRFLTVTHGALADQKYERIKVGTLVPEPNAFGLLMIGGLGLLGRRRKRRS